MAPLDEDERERAARIMREYAVLHGVEVPDPDEDVLPDGGVRVPVQKAPSGKSGAIAIPEPE